MNPASDEDRDVAIGGKLTEIGQILAGIARGEPDGTYMYAEADAGWSCAAIFEDLGDRLLFRAPNDELFEEIRQLWKLFEPARRWTNMEYQIVGERFNASFDYDDLDADDSVTSIDRRQAKARVLFGDKPIDYSDTGRDQDFIDEHLSDMKGV